MHQIGTAAGIGGIEMADLQAEIIDHRHHPARGIAGAEIAVDIVFGQPGVFQRTLGDFGMQLRSGFVRCVPGRMLINPGDVGLALDRQYGSPLVFLVRWRFLWPVGTGLASAEIFRQARQ